MGQRKVLDNCPTSPCCPCFQNPVSRGHPAHHPCECPKHKPTLVVSLPRNSAAPVAPRGSHLQLPSTLYCARAPCAAPPSTPLPNTVAVPPPSLRTAGPWAGNACSPTPPPASLPRGTEFTICLVTATQHHKYLLMCVPFPNSRWVSSGRHKTCHGYLGPSNGHAPLGGWGVQDQGVRRLGS